MRETAERLGIDAKTAERDLKAAAWDAQQEARAAESRLRAAGSRVVDETAHIASRVGAEARHLAGEGRERITHLRHRDEQESAAERELARLRAEIDELRAQLGGPGKRADKGYSGIAARFAGKGKTMGEAMAAQAAAAAIAQVERSLREKAPALLAAKNRAQVMEILQKEMAPTLRDSAVQAASAALSIWETSRERVDLDAAKDRTAQVAEDVEERARRLSAELEVAARRAAEEAEESAHAAAVAVEHHRRWGRPHLPGRGRGPADEAMDATGEAREKLDELVHAAVDGDHAEEEHRGRAGLFWGGAGLGLALYALLDAERREKVLRLANEASVQVQELVRDLQGYDDEF
jgi:hypothetical protein